MRRSLCGQAQFPQHAVPPPHRYGFSILELVVVIALIGLLLAMLLPAVQTAREASRRVSCVNNLKQIGIVCQDYDTSYGEFPSAGDEVYIRIGVWAKTNAIWDCPTDPLSSDPRNFRSYLANVGTHFRMADDYRNGYVCLYTPRRAKNFVDGQSSTAMFAERLTVPGNPTPDVARAYPERFLGWTSQAVPRVAGNEPLFAERCRNERSDVLPLSQFHPTVIGEGYDHFLPPNHLGCWNGSFEDSDRHEKIVPASSLHPGGVNVVFVDGHVAFIAEDIDELTWRALGTINGAEAVSDGRLF